MADLLGVGFTTLQRWRRQFAGDGDGLDGRKDSPRQVYHRLTDEERHRILLTCNQPEFAALLPGQIVPVLADRGLYNSFVEDSVYGSECSFYRVLDGPRVKVRRRGRARRPQEPCPVPRLEARGPNQVWSWDITDLPTSVRGVWIFQYRVIDVWSRKVVAWDVAEREEALIAARLVSRACLRERISKGRPNPLILHADNGIAMGAAMLESRLEELGVLGSFSWHPISAIEAKQMPSASSVLASTSRLASGIPAAGAAALAAGVSRRLSGSILRQRTTAALRLNWQWPPDLR